MKSASENPQAAHTTAKKRRVRVVLDLTPKQADLLSMIAVGHALAFERGRAECAMWSKVASAVAAAQRK